MHYYRENNLKSNLFEFSIVITAETFNPTILNPDFLRIKNIVPEDWDWQLSAAPISTPPFATVSYDSGVSILVEATKFQVVERGQQINVADSRISDVAKKYIEVLEHTPYKEIGINLTSFIDLDDPNDFLKERFIKEGDWNNEAFALKEAGLSFNYEINEGSFNLKINKGAFKDKDTDKSGIVLYGNFHRACKDVPKHEIFKELIKHIDNRQKDIEYYNKISQVILGE
jgi:hypothetical protein